MAEEEVRAFLHKLETLDCNLFYYQRETILSSPLVKNRMLEPSYALKARDAWLQRNGKRAPLQGLNVGDAKNLSYDELEKITNKFGEKNFIGRVGCGRLFRGFVDDGERVREVTVKTWDFVFPSAGGCADYSRKFHDEIVLLERSELKAHPFFVNLIGFCFEKKLAVVYDLEFKRFLWNSLTPAEFGWKELMKVATNYALLLKTLTMRKFKLSFTSDDIMVDEDYNIKLVNFRVHAFPGDTTHGTCNSATVSDDTSMEKSYVFELGLLLLELITKRMYSWEHKSHPGLYIESKGSSIVDETLDTDADSATEITQLIGSCVRVQPAQRPRIESVFDELARIAGYRPAASDSYP